MNQRTPNTGTTEMAAEVSSAGPHMSRFLYRCDRDGRRDDTHAEVPLSSPVRTFLRPVGHGTQLGFRCLSISAVRGDGVTTARQETERTIDQTYRGSQLLILEGDPVEGELRNLFEIVSRRRIIQAARKAGAQGLPRSLRPWVTVAVIVAAIVITAALSLLTPLGGSQRGLPSLVHPLSLLSVVAIAALGVLGQWLINFSSREKDREPPEEKIADWVAGKQHSKPYENFISSLTAKFAGFDGLRCLIVDDFSHLDRPTRDVLIRYMRDYATDRPPELWVVFDPSDEPGRGEFAASIRRLRAEARLTPGYDLPEGVRRVQLFGLAPLNAEQKNELALRVGHPERAGYRTVKAIVSDKDDTLPVYFDEQIPATGPRQDPARYGAFELLYLLSLATVSSGNIEWPKRGLLKKLAEQRQRSAVLREILTGSGRSKSGPSKTDLAERLERLPEDFGRVTTVVKRGSDLHVTISAEVGNLLARLSGRFGLADSGLGHLFWALYRNDNRAATADDAFWLNNASEHLLRAASPHDYAKRFGADSGPLADRLFWAILDAVGDCLRLSQLEQIPRLLQRAADLLEDHDRKNRAALLRRARDAYAVLADDTILRILLDLRSAGEPEQVGEGNALTGMSALELFLQASAGAAQLNATASAFEPGHSLAPLKEDAELRGSWLALSLQPFVTSRQEQLAVAIARARVTVPLTAKAILSAQVERPGDREVADLVNLSIGLWCWALIEATDDVIIEGESAQELKADIASELETAYYVALELRNFYLGDNSRNSGNAVDLARDGLAEELLTVTAATALLVKQAWQGMDQESIGKIEEVLNASMDELKLQVPKDGSEAGTSEKILDTLSERMSLLQVTWKALGYQRLSTMLNARRIQLTALLTPATATLSRAQIAERGSVEDRDQVDLLGLLINLAVARQALPSVEAAAEALVYGVTASLGGEMAEKLSAQLCALAIGYAHSFETNLQPVVRYLLGTSQTDPRGTRLDQWLASIDDEQVVGVTLEILNVAGHERKSGQRLVTALKDRAESVSDEDIKSLLQEQFSIYELKRRQEANEPIAVDEELETWVGHEKSVSYPYMLFRLVAVNDIPLSPRLQQTIADVLENFRSYLSQNGIVLLCVKLASRFSRQARSGSPSPPEFGKDSLVDVLRASVDGWSGHLPVETNITILEFLHEYDAAHADEYEAQLAYWREEKLRLIEERDLPHLISAGRYVLLMLAYLDTLSEYGMQTTTANGETPLSLSGKTVSTAENAQLRRAAEHPFLAVSGKPVLNMQFYLGARKLFLSDLSKDAQYDDIRFEFNNAARKSMPQLFTFLIDLERIPRPIRTLLERHERMVRSRLVTQDPSLWAL